jgi:hypothetical protein
MKNGETMIEDTRDLLEFKSIPEIFEKERSGRKPNTLRTFENKDDERLIKIYTGVAKRIRITNTETKETFERTITDITNWNENWIISWAHRGGL